jgi:hypothetical protein
MNAQDFFKLQRLDENGTFNATQMIMFANDLQIYLTREQLLKMYRENLDFSKITNIQVADVDSRDYPDFCDAYIEACDYNGEPANDEMLEVINEDGDFVHEQAHLSFN